MPRLLAHNELKAAGFGVMAPCGAQFLSDIPPLQLDVVPGERRAGRPSQFLALEFRITTFETAPFKEDSGL